MKVQPPSSWRPRSRRQFWVLFGFVAVAATWYGKRGVEHSTAEKPRNAW